MKHKHADVLHAIADGKMVQWERGSMYGNKTGVWVDFNPDINYSPLELNGSHFNWRIKPEPKPDIVRYISCDFRFESYYVTSEKCGGDNLKLTFDGETGKLKTAEVL